MTTHDSQLMPPMAAMFGPGTPSGLTPNTRSEAEAALTLNSIAQTDSAAPTASAENNGSTEAHKAYRRPAGPLRTSSANYEKALLKARQQSSVSSDFSVEESTENAENASTHASHTTSAMPFPAPGQGVVPLHTGVGSGQAEALKRVRPAGLSLEALGRQQSWNEQDMKHVFSAGLMAEPKGDAGYSSGREA